MATIDLIVLGMLKKEALSAYDIQKLVEYRNISKWVKISTPSIYKKVIQLEEKGYISSNIVKEGKMPEKAIYSLTEAGEKQLENLNAVIVNLDALLPENQMKCLTDIEANIKTLKSYLEKNLKAKENVPEIPQTGLAVLQQQFILAQSIETWIDELKLKYE